MKEINPFTNIDYVAIEQAQSREANAVSGAIGNWQVDPSTLKAGDGKNNKEVGHSSEAGNERVFVGSKTNPLVLMGQLKDVTGVDEYGLWVKGAALYLGGYKQYDVIATKEGIGVTTVAYYAGKEYTSIKAAVDQAETDGKTDLTIFVRAGTYLENENTTGWNMNIRIIGEDKDKSIIFFDTGQKYWRYNKNIYIEKVSFIGYSASNALIYAEGSDYVYIDNVDIENQYSHANGAGGIRIGACTDLADTGVTIKNCNIQCVGTLSDNPNGLYAGICISGDRGNVRLKENIIFTSGYAVWLAGTTNQIRFFIIQNMIGMDSSSTLTRGSGIYVNSNYLQQSLIEGNGIFQNTGTGYFPCGIYFQGSGSVIQSNKIINNFVIAAEVGYDILTSGVVFSGNQAAGCESHGMVIRGYLPNSDNINSVVGNSVYSCGGEGISLDGSNFTVTGNTIFNCAAGIGDAAATISQHYNITCSANVIRSCDYGIRIRGASSAVSTYDLNFSNNTISGNISQTTGIGISIGTSFQNVIIKGNTIRYFAVGVGLDQATASSVGYINISDNDIDSMDYVAINLDGQDANNFKITNNHIPQGIILESLTNSNINDNFIYGAMGIAILAACLSSDITGNNIEVSTNNGILVTTDLGNSKICNNKIVTTAAGAQDVVVNGNMYDSIIDNNWMDSEINCIGIAGNLTNGSFNGNILQYDGDGFGIYVGGNVDAGASNMYGSVINGNNIHHDDTTGATPCVYIAGNARNLTVTGNKLYGGNSGDYVIVIVGTTDNCLFAVNRNGEGLAAGSIGDGIQGTGTRTNNAVYGNLKT
jgi:parallel beta-helix repeat protein